MLALACTLALALLAAPRAAHAGKSHLLQKPERHVVLTNISLPGVDQCGGIWVNQGLGEIRPDGTVASQEFVVPPGQVLVVTDVDWRTHELPASFVQGRMHAFAICLGPNNTTVFQTGTLIDADLATAGVWLGSASLTAGFQVGPGVAICPRSFSNTSSAFITNSVLEVILRGYLVKAK